jgi:hypothetical protein
LLPLFDNEHMPLPQEVYRRVRLELTEQFGGLTAYTRAPAEGRWKDETQKTSSDEIVIFEVMIEVLDRTWWSQYRQKLETWFRQQLIVIRSETIELL